MPETWLDEPVPPSLPAGDFGAVTRFEVIDASGRIVTRYDVSVDAQLQDDGRTLKIFLTERDGT